MTERCKDDLDKEILSCRSQISELAQEIEDHQIEKHKGTFASTCHTCVRLQSTLRSARMLLEVLEN